MSFWTLDNLRLVIGGRWIHRPAASLEQSPTGASTDSRTLRRGQVFVALRGERFDGNHFLPQALNAGAVMAIVDREPATGSLRSSSAAVMLVDDAYTALARLAGAYRKTLGAGVIAITGSVGKTTTKQMVHAVLSQGLRGTASPASYNNRIGVPLTLLNVGPTDRYVVAEVGTSAPGEIGALGKIIQPNVAVITHIGEAHLKKLGSVEAVAAEKATLLRHLSEDGLAIVNGDLPILNEYLRAVRRVVRYGTYAHCDLRLTDYQAGENGVRFRVNDRASFTLPLAGVHNAINALAAVAVGRHLNLSDEQIARGLAGVQPMGMRLEVHRIGGTRGQAPLVLIDDAYNANPLSMAAAIGVLSETPCEHGRRIAILGDMAELGNQSPQLHRQLGEQLGESNVDQAVLIGPMSLFTAEALGRRWSAARVHAIADWSEQTPSEVAALLRPGDVVLIKASRASALERLVPAIRRQFDQPRDGDRAPTNVV
jgi:UDP-N-acetylmuramoyl-tripeptide--D-alanyl-D-alanine ligase